MEGRENGACAVQVVLWDWVGEYGGRSWQVVKLQREKVVSKA